MKTPFAPHWAALALVFPLLAGCMVAVVPMSASMEAAPRAEPRPAPAVDVGDFAPNEQELALGRLLERHPEQRRTSLSHSLLLAYVARMRAVDIARRGPFGHVNRDGLGPNTLVRRAGYQLPQHYDRQPTGNNIESLGMGLSSAREAWAMWMRSDAHRRHLLGLHPVYMEQTEYGVGQANGYWVVLIARPASGGLASLQPRTIEVVAESRAGR